MSILDVVLALVIAASALYALGLPVAWLFPAPAESQWVFRIAIAPLYAIVLASVGGLALGGLGVGLHPWQLVVLGAALWVLAIARSGRSWRLPTLDDWAWPAAVTAAASALWLLSVAGYGLHLPNRDFKNHAYWVAQVAQLGSADPARVLATSPVHAVKETAFYPLGLHTLLGWALPTSSFSSVGVTAAATVVVSAVSLPLAMISLARLWQPNSRGLAQVSSLAAVCLPGFTFGFDIGSVTMIVGTALYAAALALLWFCYDRPTPGSVMALGLAALGLFQLHLSEAVGLFLVALVALPVLKPWRRVGFSMRMLVAVLVPTALVLVTVGQSLTGLGWKASTDWDIVSDSAGPLISWMLPLLIQPGGRQPLGLIWTYLALVGIVIGYRARLSWFPVVTLVVPLGLSFLAVTPGVPGFLTSLSAPWYGAAARISLLAAPALALLGSLAVARLLSADRLWIRVMGVAAIAALILAQAPTVVSTRRGDLQASLAGAGDTPDVARFLNGVLLPGETVLNMEGEGTTKLFTFARVPVLDGYHIERDTPSEADERLIWLQEHLLQVGNPDVAAAMEESGVRYVAVGTTTPYWGPVVSYTWQQLAAQGQFEPVFFGTDMAILRYTPAA